MRECPAGWTEESLGDVADIRVSNVDKKSYAGQLPVRLCNYMDVYTNEYLDESRTYMRATASAPEIQRFGLRPGDVVITKDSETPDDIAIAAVIDGVPDRLVCGYHLAILRPSERLIGSWLSKQLSQERARRYFAQRATGSTRYGLSNEAISGFPTWIPPVEEQRRTATILRTLDEAIRRTEQVIAKLQQMKQGLLHDLLTRGIDDNGELRDPERHPEQFKDSELGKIPVGWDVGSIEHYLSANDGIKPGPFGSSITKSMYTDSGYRVYGQEQVIAGCLAVGGYYISASKFSELSGFAVQAEDLLISLVGTVGRALVVREPYEVGIINPRLMRLRPARDLTDVEFLKHLVTSSVMRRQLERLATGGTMPVLNSRVVRSVILPLVPRAEQSLIGSQLDGTDARMAAEAKAIAQLRVLKAGLMDDLLTGRMRVTVPEETAA